MMDPVTVRTGTKRFDGEAHGVRFSVYVRSNGEVKLWVKRSMRLKGGPQTMFGSDFGLAPVSWTRLLCGRCW